MSAAKQLFDALDHSATAMSVDALTASRRKALEHFKKRGFPTTRDEDWKYTDLKDVIEISQRSLESATMPLAPDMKRISELQSIIDADWIVIANGVLIEEPSSALKADGVSVSKLQPEHDSLQLEHPLADFNLALLRDGVSILVNGDRLTEKPIGLLIIDSVDDSPALSQVRVDFELQANATAQIVEYHVSSGTDEHYSNTHINVIARKNSRVDFLRFQNRALHHSQTERLNVKLDAESTINHCGIDVGGRLTRNDLKIDINGSGATANFDGLYIVAGDQHVDNHTRIDHRVGPANSSQEYRGVLSGRCRAVWNGKAIVHTGADGTDAKQANHNLLLSENAEINAKPELEIYADEVKCAHGTTVGQLDENALFYLRSRGLDEGRAKRMLTRAFAANIVNNSPIAELREHIGNAVEQRLNKFVSAQAQ